MKIIITFKTATAATKAHWKASEEGIECKLIPTPQELGVKCGYSLCASLSDKEHLLGIIGEYSEIFERSAI